MDGADREDHVASEVGALPGDGQGAGSSVRETPPFGGGSYLQEENLGVWSSNTRTAEHFPNG